MTESLLKNHKEILLSFWHDFVTKTFQPCKEGKNVSDVQSWVVKLCKACDVIKQKCGVFSGTMVVTQSYFEKEDVCCPNLNPFIYTIKSRTPFNLESPWTEKSMTKILYSWK